ncbi:hypothetical protein ES703_116831 [subsurface metagenome]
MGHFFSTAPGFHDQQPGFYQGINHHRRILQQAAGIVPQVNHQAINALTVQLLDRITELLSGVPGKAGNPNKSNAAIDAVIGHVVYIDLFPDQGNIQGILLPVALEGEGHFCTRLAADHSRRFVRSNIKRTLMVNFDNLIAGTYAGPVRGGALHGRYHGEGIIPDTQTDSNPAIPAASQYAHRRLGFLLDEYCVGIEAVKHSPDAG